MEKIKTLFLDIGGVLLTNGFDRQIREKALKKFNLDEQKFNPLNKKYYDLHEQGKIDLKTYLKKTIFYKKRSFSEAEFIKFIEEQSKPHPEMLKAMHEIKQKYHLTVAALSNEGKELAKYRIKTFNLNSLFDFFIVSSFVGHQKPDPKIYKMAEDIAGCPLNEIIYVDDRDYLIEAASKLGMRGILHTSLETTKKKLNQLL